MANAQQAKYQRVLADIRDQRCGGSIAELARRLDKDPTYVGRLFYPDGKAGRKGIGLEIMQACARVFLIPLSAWDAGTGSFHLTGAGQSGGVSGSEADGRDLSQPLVVARYFELARKAERKGLHLRTTDSLFAIHAGKDGPKLFTGDNVTALLRKVKAFKWDAGT